MYCRRSAVDDVRSRRSRAVDEDRRRIRWAVDEDRHRRRWACDDDRRRRRREIDDYPPLELPLQWRDPPPEYPSPFYSASRKGIRNQPLVVDDYPPLELPLRWRDPPPEYPPPEYPPLELPLRWRDPPPQTSASSVSPPLSATSSDSVESFHRSGCVENLDTILLQVNDLTKELPSELDQLQSLKPMDLPKIPAHSADETTSPSASGDTIPAPLSHTPLDWQPTENLLAYRDVDPGIELDLAACSDADLIPASQPPAAIQSVEILRQEASPSHPAMPSPAPLKPTKPHLSSCDFVPPTLRSLSDPTASTPVSHKLGSTFVSAHDQPCFTPVCDQILLPELPTASLRSSKQPSIPALTGDQNLESSTRACSIYTHSLQSTHYPSPTSPIRSASTSASDQAGAPIRLNTPLAFCSYNGSSCCNPTDDAELQKQFSSMNISDSACGSIVKLILCTKCDPYSSDLFTVETKSRKVPILCSNEKSNEASMDFCNKVWNTCKNKKIQNSLFSAAASASEQISSSKLADHWKSSTEFCKALGGSADTESICFNGTFVSFKNTIDLSPPQGICVEKIGNGSYLSMEPHPDGSDRVFLSDQAGLIWLASVPTQDSGGTLDLNESNIFLDLTDRVHADTAFGVMGLAFHPNFTKNGHFFVSFHCDKVHFFVSPSEATSVFRLAEGSKSLILQAVHEMSTIALRCLGVAYKDDVADVFNYDGEGHPAHKFLLDPSNYAFIGSDLIFAGLVGLRDPIREEVYQAIEDCKAIDIRIMSFGNFQEATLQEENIENKVFDPGICLPPYFPSN